MKLIVAVTTALLVASPVLAARDNQFDLVCTGKQTLATGKPATAWNERFRFDLDAKRWCRGACKSAAEIATITADQITLYNSRAAVGGPVDAELVLSRTQGTVNEYVTNGWSGRAFGLAEGSCKRAYFSGLPGQKF